LCYAPLSLKSVLIIQNFASVFPIWKYDWFLRLLELFTELWISIRHCHITFSLLMLGVCGHIGLVPSMWILVEIYRGQFCYKLSYMIEWLITVKNGCVASSLRNVGRFYHLDQSRHRISQCRVGFDDIALRTFFQISLKMMLILWPNPVHQPAARWTH